MSRAGLAELSSVNVICLPRDVAPQIARFARGSETAVSSSLLVNPGLVVVLLSANSQVLNDSAPYFSIRRECV